MNINNTTTKETTEKNKPLILIVDDVPKNIQVLAGILNQKQMRLAVAQTGAQVFEMLERISPDLILLDIMLPDINGFDICQRLKQDERTRHIPIIFLTAKIELEDMVKGFEAEAVDYVTKPFNPIELRVRVKTQLDLKRSRDAERELIGKLQALLEQVKLLSGLIPICFSCKKIRNDSGFWEQVELYIEKHSEALFSHGICPDCLVKLYPEMANEILAKRQESPDSSKPEDKGPISQDY
jgi:CheY-like chemotaxis protein